MAYFLFWQVSAVLVSNENDNNVKCHFLGCCDNLPVILIAICWLLEQIRSPYIVSHYDAHALNTTQSKLRTYRRRGGKGGGEGRGGEGRRGKGRRARGKRREKRLHTRAPTSPKGLVSLEKGTMLVSYAVVLRCLKATCLKLLRLQRNI